MGHKFKPNFQNLYMLQIFLKQLIWFNSYDIGLFSVIFTSELQFDYLFS